MNVLDNILARVDDFPTLPTIYTALMDVMANPRSSVGDAADVIAQDQASASKVLKIANSPIYGIHGRVDTITQAIFYIGFDEVKNLVIALSIVDLFSSTKSLKNINPVNFWKHSFAVGCISRFLGKAVGVKKLENYFLAGILHDIGKMLIFKFLPDQYSDVLSRALEQNVELRESESEMLKATHTVAGDMLAEKWRLPASIRNTIKNHHAGLVDGEIETLTACVHVANVVAHLLGLGLHKKLIVPKVNSIVWKKIKLPDGFFTKSLQNILMDYYQAVNLLLVK